MNGRLDPGALMQSSERNSQILFGNLPFSLQLTQAGRADERTRIADLISLRVMHHVLQGPAQECKSRISKPVSFLSFARCCTALLSRWYQSGVRSPWMHGSGCGNAVVTEVYDMTRHETTCANR